MIDHNLFTSIPDCFYMDQSKDGNDSIKLKNLTYLDISHNNIETSKQLNLSMKTLRYAFYTKIN